jgi:DNA-binding transcriptional ArsR family regulator
MNLKRFLDTAEQAITDVAAKVGPILAPLPTSYAIGRSVIVNLHWPEWLGYVSGAVIELLGLATVNTALTLRNYNAGKRKSDPSAPVGLAMALTGVYLGTAVVLAVLLDVMPQLARWTPAVFPFLSISGSTVLALRNDQRQRVVAIEEEAEKRRKRRAERRKERKRAEMDEEAQRKLAEADRKLEEARRKAAEAQLASLGSETETLQYYQEHNPETQAEAAETLGVSERTIRNHLRKLEEAGAIQRNGQGVEVLV